MDLKVEILGVGIYIASNQLNIEVAQAMSKKIKAESRPKKLPIPLKYIEGVDWVTV
jgi:hypothetical protein